MEFDSELNILYTGVYKVKFTLSNLVIIKDQNIYLKQKMSALPYQKRRPSEFYWQTSLNICKNVTLVSFFRSSFKICYLSAKNSKSIFRSYDIFFGEGVGVVEDSRQYVTGKKRIFPMHGAI